MRIRFKTVRSPRLKLNDGEPVEPPKKDEKKDEKGEKKTSPWKQKHSKKRFLGIMFAMFVGLVVLMVIGVAVSVGLFLYSGSDAAIEISNLTSNSATVVWVSEISEPGVAIAMKGEVPSFQLGMTEGMVGYDDRDYADAEEKAALKYQQMVESGGDASNVVSEVKVKKFGWYKVHHVTFKDLDPGTQYNVMVGNGYLFKPIENNTFTTRPQEDFFSLPSPAYGLVVKTSGGQAVQDGVLRLALVDDNGSLITDKLSAPLGENGSWYIDLNSLYRVTGERYSETSTEYEFDTTLELHEVVTAEGLYQQKLDTWNDAPSPNFVLDQADFTEMENEVESSVFDKAVFTTLARPMEEASNWDDTSNETEGDDDEGYHPVNYQTTDDMESGATTGGGRDDSTDDDSSGESTTTEQEEHSPDPNHPHYTVPEGNHCSDGDCGAVNYECLVNKTKSDDCWRLCVNGYWALPEGCYNWNDGGSGDGSQDDDSDTPELPLDTNGDGVVDENDDPEAPQISPYVCCWHAVKTSFARTTKYTATESCPSDYTLLGPAEEPSDCDPRFRAKDDGKYVDEEGRTPSSTSATAACCVQGNKRQWDFNGECTYSDGHWSIDDSISRYECVDGPDTDRVETRSYCCKLSSTSYTWVDNLSEAYCTDLRGGDVVNFSSSIACDMMEDFARRQAARNAEGEEEQEEEPGQEEDESPEPPEDEDPVVAVPATPVEGGGERNNEPTCQQWRRNPASEYCSVSECTNAGCMQDGTTTCKAHMTSQEDPGSDYGRYYFAYWTCENVPDNEEKPYANNVFTIEGVTNPLQTCQDNCISKPQGWYVGSCSEVYSDSGTPFNSSNRDWDGCPAKTKCEYQYGSMGVNSHWMMYPLRGYKCEYPRSPNNTSVNEQPASVKLLSVLKGFIFGASAQEENQEELTVLYSPERKAYIFEEAGQYVILHEGEVLEVLVADVDDSYFIFADKNENGIYDEEVDTLITTNPEELNFTKVSDAFGYEIRPGYNFVSFNFIPENYDAVSSSFLRSLNENYDNNFYSIATYDSSGWKIIGERNGEVYGVENFQIVPGRGYLLKAKEYMRLDIAGSEVTSPVPVTLSSGWNLIGIHGGVDLYTAESAINSMDDGGVDVDNITVWDSTLGRYKGLQQALDDSGQSQVYGTDYPIVENSAYFVRVVNGSSNWTPE